MTWQYGKMNTFKVLLLNFFPLLLSYIFCEGTGCEMYTETLSPTFTGMTFAQASELCFVKLKLLLLALEVRPDDGGDAKISINPRGTKIPANTVGFFIAQSAEEVKRYFSIKKKDC